MGDLKKKKIEKLPKHKSVWRAWKARGWEGYGWRGLDAWNIFGMEDCENGANGPWAPGKEKAPHRLWHGAWAGLRGDPLVLADQKHEGEQRNEDDRLERPGH